MLFLHANISRRTLCSPDSSYPFNSLKISSSNSDRSSRFGTSQMIHRFARELHPVGDFLGHDNKSCVHLATIDLLTYRILTFLLAFSIIYGGFQGLENHRVYLRVVILFEHDRDIPVSLQPREQSGGGSEFRLNAGASETSIESGWNNQLVIFRNPSDR